MKVILSALKTTHKMPFKSDPKLVFWFPPDIVMRKTILVSDLILLITSISLSTEKKQSCEFIYKVSKKFLER